MRLVALTRVSGRTQARDGAGLEDQEARIRAWAKAEKVRIVAWCRDEGVSGLAPVDERPGLVEALVRLRKGQADGIVVASLDRLSRDVVLQEQLHAELGAGGWRLRSALPGEDHALVHDDADPSRALIRRILAAIAAYERDMIRLRLRGGREAKAAAGGYLHGRPPYGWIASGKELLPLEAEQRVRRQIKEWAKAGESSRAIAARLNSDGVPSKTGGMWSSKTVLSVINNTRRATKPRPTSPRAIRSTGSPDPGQKKAV